MNPLKFSAVYNRGPLSITRKANIASNKMAYSILLTAKIICETKNYKNNNTLCFVEVYASGPIDSNVVDVLMMMMITSVEKLTYF